MKPDEAAKELAKRARALHDVPINNAALDRVAREVASTIKGHAARAGHSIGIRVIAKRGGIRLTITGYRATLYRKMALAELERRVPDIKAEIRTQLRSKP